MEVERTRARLLSVQNEALAKEEAAMHERDRLSAALHAARQQVAVLQAERSVRLEEVAHSAEEKEHLQRLWHAKLADLEGQLRHAMDQMEGVQLDQTHAEGLHAVEVQQSQEQHKADVAALMAAQEQLAAELEQRQRAMEAQAKEVSEARQEWAQRSRELESSLAELRERAALLTEERDAAMSFQHAQDSERARWRHSVAALQRRVGEVEEESARWRGEVEVMDRERAEWRAQQTRGRVQADFLDRKAKDQRERQRFIDEVIAVRSIPRFDALSLTGHDRRRGHRKMHPHKEPAAEHEEKQQEQQQQGVGQPP